MFKVNDVVIWLGNSMGIVREYRGKMSHDSEKHVPRAFASPPEDVFQVEFVLPHGREAWGCWASDLTRYNGL